MPGDVLAQVGDQAGALAPVEEEAGAQLDGLRPQLLQPDPLAFRPGGAGHVGVGGATPGRERLTERGHLAGGAPGAGQDVLEAVHVDVLARHAQGVAGTLGDQDAGRGAGRPAGFEGTAQRGDERAQGADGAGRRLIGPQVVDERLGGDHPPLGGDETPEDLTVAGPAEGDGTAVVAEGPDGAEDVDAHGVHPAGARPHSGVPSRAYRAPGRAY